MERNRGNKQNGMILLFLVLFLLGVYLPSASEAAVSLKGYAEKNSGLNAAVMIAAGDGFEETANDTTYEYVYFGRYPQPILWRVLSSDKSGTMRKALLLSEKNLAAKAFDARQSNPNAADTSFWETGVTWDYYNNN